MKYAIYFRREDGTSNSFNENSAENKNKSIRILMKRKEIVYVGYCRIYANGEYGKMKILKGVRK